MAKHSMMSESLDRDHPAKLLFRVLAVNFEALDVEIHHLTVADKAVEFSANVDFNY